MGAVWMRVRAEWRARRRALISITLLGGLFGGTVLATLAGAQRTQTAYPRFLERSRAYDVLVTDSTLFADVFWKPDFDALARLPYVAEAIRIEAGYFHAGGDLPEGGGFFTSLDPRYLKSVDLPVLVRGRLPKTANEVAVPFFADRTTENHSPDLGSYRVGDRIQLSAHDHDVTLAVVGETALPGELPPRPTWGWGVQVAPAFVDAYARGCEQGGPSCLVDFTLPSMMLRFAHRSDIAMFDRDVRKMTHGKVLASQELSSHTRAVQRSTDLQAIALRLLGLFLALTGIMILGQLLVREVGLGASDASTLRALGLRSAQHFWLAMVRMAPVAFGGALLAAALAFLASPLFPRGSVRVIESSRFAFDGHVIGWGFGVITVVIVALVAFSSWRATTAIGRIAVDAARPSSLAGSFATMGLSASAVAGARLALERGRGKTAVPVVSSLAVVAIGIASFVAATTFAVSLQSLIERPELYGKTWKDVITTQDDRFNEDPQAQKDYSARAEAALVRDPDIIALSVIDSGAPVVVFAPSGPPRGIATTAMSIVNLKGDLSPPVVEGRALIAPRDVEVGARMIASLGLELDATHPPEIEIALQGVGDRRMKLNVVGRAVIPPLGNYGELGFGLMMGSTTPVGDLLDDPSMVPPVTDLIVRWRPGADPKTVLARYTKEFPSLRIGEGLTGGSFAAAVDFGGVQGAPLIVGGVLALLGAAALAHVLVTAIRRRRRDIAILKAIGFVRGQARRAVAWQATIIVALAAIIGTPLGLIAGRWLWRQVADGIGVLPNPSFPGGVLLLLGPAVLVLANLIAALPARTAARTQPALVLRSE